MVDGFSAGGVEGVEALALALLMRLPIEISYELGIGYVYAMEEEKSFAVYARQGRKDGQGI